jgi:multiple sugar transport system permease protein
LPLRRLRPYGWWLLAGPLLVVTLGPLAYMITISLRPNADVFARPFAYLPPHPTLSNYHAVLSGSGTTEALFLDSLGRTAVVSLATTAISIPLSALGAYALARYRFHGEGAVGVGILLTQMVPPFLLVVPLFVVFRTLHLVDTLQGLVLADLSFALPFCIWMLRGYFLALPRNVEEAAMLDGASRLRAIWDVVLPLAAPGLVASAVFAFILAWSEFLFAFVLSNGKPLATVALYAYSGRYGTQYGQLMAASVLLAAPPLVLYAIVQRRLLAGLASGAVTG